MDEETERVKQRKRQAMLENNPSLSQRSRQGEQIILTDNNFGEAIASQPLMLVDFWAEWCGPCKMVAPVIEQLAHDYAGKVSFGKLNVDENPVVSNAFQIQSIPALLVFKKGKLVDGIIGAVPKHIIESKIKAHLNN